MLFVIVGTLLVVLKFLDVAPVVNWSWWAVLSPFALALLWWLYSDATGLTRKRQMDKLDGRREARRRRSFEALGIDYRFANKEKSKVEAYKRARQAQVDKVEGVRDEVRRRNEETIARSTQLPSQLDPSVLEEADNRGTEARR